VRRLDRNLAGSEWSSGLQRRLSPEEYLGHLRNAKRRILDGPGIENFDIFKNSAADTDEMYVLVQ